MTPDQKLCYSEGMLWRNRVKAQAIAYAGEVVRTDPYTLIPTDPPRSLTYHQNRVRVSQTCLAQPDMFAQQNAAHVALDCTDPLLVDDLGLKGAVINLWEILAGGIPPPPPESEAPLGDGLRDGQPPAREGRRP
jgi:hypothetical protein